MVCKFYSKKVKIDIIIIKIVIFYKFGLCFVGDVFLGFNFNNIWEFFGVGGVDIVEYFDLLDWYFM